MVRQEELRDRLYDFALAIVKLVRKLPREIAAVEMGRQVLKAGTSIAANYEEATGAFSRSDFVYKLSISFREAKETNLWLRLLRDSGVIQSSQNADFLIQECLEITNIFAKSIKTARNNLSKLDE